MSSGHMANDIYIKRKIKEAILEIFKWNCTVLLLGRIKRMLLKTDNSLNSILVFTRKSNT